MLEALSDGLTLSPVERLANPHGRSVVKHDRHPLREEGICMIIMLSSDHAVQRREART
jgi:hypothetical protein